MKKAKKANPCNAMANAAIIMDYLSPMAQGMLLAEGGTAIDHPV